MSCEAASHVVPLSYPEQPADPKLWRYLRGQEYLADYLIDAANTPGGYAAAMVEFLPGAGASEMSAAVRQVTEAGGKILPVASQSSLTGAAVPFGETVFNMRRLQNAELIKTDEGYFVDAKPGLTTGQLEALLKRHNLFFPAATTFPGATIGGAIGTDAKGASSYKYGSTRKYVVGLDLVLASGETFSLRRGQNRAHEDHYFILDSETGRRWLPIPTYSLPDVPKFSVGYYAEPAMDLIDLFAGSEGTLALTASALIRVLEEPPTFTAVVNCRHDDEAFKLIDLLNAVHQKQANFSPGGIRAAEYIGSRVLKLIQKYGKSPLAAGTGALVIIDIEGQGESDQKDEETVQTLLIEKCESLGIDSGKILLAYPFDSTMKHKIKDLREAPPEIINMLISRLRQTDPSITKVSSDFSVRPDKVAQLRAICEPALTAAGLDYYVWGHGEGNYHYNVLSSSAHEVDLANKVMYDCGKKIIERLGGCGSGEHNVGKNRTKKALMRLLYGEAGLSQMAATKRALDPGWVLAPGNILDKKN